MLSDSQVDQYFKYAKEFGITIDTIIKEPWEVMAQYDSQVAGTNIVRMMILKFSHNDINVIIILCEIVEDNFL